MSDQTPFDSILLVSFGGPEGPDEVLPFLENVLRGKNVPRERMLEVVEHYQHFGGVSPINAQNRSLIAALRTELDANGIDLPIYWGNRNWHPMLAETLREMKADGRQRAVAFFTSMFSCYSGCRQYRENIQVAQQEVGEGAPAVQKVRKGFNHPLFIEAQADLVLQGLEQIAASKRAAVKLLFTAHSIPMSMADNSNYVKQLKEAARLVASKVTLKVASSVASTGNPENWELVFQSRSGPPQQPWLEPDVCDRIEQLAAEGITDVAIIPLGFVSDHMEVLFDLDTEAKDTCKKLGLGMVRVASVGTHPLFVKMICELLRERIEDWPNRAAIGDLPASHDVCPVDCCLYPQPRRPQ